MNLTEVIIMTTINYRDLNKAIRKMNTELEGLVLIENQSEDKVQLTINWCSIGSVESQRAIEMATLLQKAAEMAKNFEYNGCEISY